MQIEYTAETLKEAIKALEIRQVEEMKQLRGEFLSVYENMKPINILKNIARDISQTDSLKHDVASTVVSLISGFISKKLLVGRSKNPLLKLIGVGIQLGMTALVSKNYNIIKEYIANFINIIQEKRDEED